MMRERSLPSIAAPVDANEADALVRRVATIRMSEPAGKDVTPEMGLDGKTRVEWSTSEAPPPAEDGTPETHDQPLGPPADLDPEDAPLPGIPENEPPQAD